MEPYLSISISHIRLMVNSNKINKQLKMFLRVEWSERFLPKTWNSVCWGWVNYQIELPRFHQFCVETHPIVVDFVVCVEVSEVIFEFITCPGQTNKLIFDQSLCRFWERMLSQQGIKLAPAALRGMLVALLLVVRLFSHLKQQAQKGSRHLMIKSIGELELAKRQVPGLH